MGSKNDMHDENDKNENNERGKRDGKNSCELFCGPSRATHAYCNLQEDEICFKPRLICKRCCCNMNYRVEAISIPENVADIMADKMAEKVVDKMEEREVELKPLKNVDDHIDDDRIRKKRTSNGHRESNGKPEADADVEAKRSTKSKKKGSKGGEAKKKKSSSGDLDNRSRTSKSGDAEYERMKSKTSKNGDAESERMKSKTSKNGDAEYERMKSKTSKNGDAESERMKSKASKNGDDKIEQKRSSTVKRYSAYSAQFDADGNPIKIADSRNSKRSSVNSPRESDERISKKSKNSDDTIVSTNDSDGEERPKNDSKSKLRTSSAFHETSKSADSASDAKPEVRGSSNAYDTTKYTDEPEAEDKTNKKNEKSRTKRSTNHDGNETTKVHNDTETPKNIDDFEAHDNSKHRKDQQSSSEEIASTTGVPLQTARESAKLTADEAEAEKREYENMLGAIRQSMDDCVKDNLDNSFGRYFTCCIAKIEELSYRTERTEYLLKKMHKDLKLRIGFLDRFMSQNNERNDDCECECTCVEDKGHSFSTER